MSDQTSTKANLTIKLDRCLLRKVRILAAKEGISISALVAAKLEEAVRQGVAHDEAKNRALAILAKGWKLGGRRLSREEMHER